MAHKVKIYGSYRFRTKDPVIDELRTLIQDHVGEGQHIRHRHLSKVERDGGPSATASRNWFFGKTKRPQSAAVEAFGRSLGFKRRWQPLTAAEKAANINGRGK